MCIFFFKFLSHRLFFAPNNINKTKLFFLKKHVFLFILNKDIIQINRPFKHVERLAIDVFHVRLS